jgi:sugar lactone lactonase YvrE
MKPESAGRKPRQLTIGTPGAERGEFTMKFKLSILGALALCLSLTANAQLNNPQGLAFDSTGHLWVANAGANNVLEMSAAGVVLNTITNGVNSPSQVFFVNGNLYVLNTGAYTITEYDNLTQAGATLVSTTSIPGTVELPLGAVVDAYGDVYVSGNQSGNIVALNVNGGQIENLTQDKEGFPFYPGGRLVIQGQNLYAAFGSSDSEDAVISYNVGEFLTGDPQEITVYNDNVNTGPTGIAFDGTGNVYISEYYSQSWVKYAPNSGSSPLCAVNSHVHSPQGIAVAKNGKIYVSNSSANNITWYRPTCAYGGTID